MKRMLVLSFLMALPLAAQQVGQGGVFQPHEVDQLKVDKAIEKGVAYLKAGNAGHLKMFGHVERQMSHCELVLYTYVHADVPETDPAFQELFQDMMKRQMEATYCVALQAMILEEMDRVKYQARIRQCAQFLVDNQITASGRWSYGAPSIFVEDLPGTPSEAPKKDVASGAGKIKDFGGGVQPGSKKKDKPAVAKKVTVKKMRDGTGGGDNSNTQYAALGLRACHDAGVIIPGDVIDRAMKWWRDSQKEEKGDAEELVEGGVNGPEKPKVGSGSGATVAAPAVSSIKAVPNGWCYGDHGDHEAYGSMSAGAIGSLAIYNYMKDDDGGKKRSWKKDKDIHEGLVWLAKKFSVTYNPGPYEHGDKAKDSKHQYYYFLYAMERAGMLYGTEIMGTHKWYPEGAKQLIADQKAGGDWGGAVDTCFAILFLKRATKPLDVATHAVGSKR